MKLKKLIMVNMQGSSLKIQGGHCILMKPIYYPLLTSLLYFIIFIQT